MIKRIKRSLILFAIVTGSLLLASCGSATVTSPPYDTEIEFPPDYTLLYVNDQVAITAHTNAPVTRMTFYVNDAPFGEMTINPAPGAGRIWVAGDWTSNIWEGHYTWTPFVPGDYLLRVLPEPVSSHSWDCEYEGGTCYLGRKSIHVRVVEPEPAAGRGGGGESPTPTAMALARMDFSADSPAVLLGSCTMLRWETSDLTGLKLDGNPVNSSGSQEVCPAALTTYKLSGDTLSGVLEKQVSVNVVPPTEKAPPTVAPPPVVQPPVVQPPVEPPTAEPPTLQPPPPVVQPPSPVPDTAGPVLSNFAAEPATIFDTSACGETAARVQVRATDASQISSVTLYYRAVRGNVQGKWVSKSMAETGKSDYSATVSLGELNQSLVSYADGFIEFYVTAVDAKGNSSTSGVISIQIKVCII